MMNDYYANLLIMQYRDKPKALATMKAITNCATCDDLFPALRRCFDLDTAVGAQLDVVGRIVGVSRNVYGLDLENTYLKLRRYDGSDSGTKLTRYADGRTYVRLRRYKVDASFQLTDDEYRLIIRLKIICNSFARLTKNIVDKVYEIFGSGVTVTANKDMSYTWTVNDSQYSRIITIANFVGVLPRPAACSITIA